MRLVATLIWFLLAAATLRAQPKPASPKAPQARAVPATASLDRFDFLLGQWYGTDARNRRLLQAWTWLNDSTLIGLVCTPPAPQRIDSARCPAWLLRISGGQVLLLRPPEGAPDAPPLRYRLSAWGPGRASFVTTEAAYPRQLTFSLTLSRQLLITSEGQLGHGMRHDEQLLSPLK